MLEINRKLASGEVRKLLLSVVERIQAVTRGLDDVSNNRSRLKTSLVCYTAVFSVVLKTAV